MNNDDDNSPSENNTLGEAANRYVTFQIVSAVIGGIIFLIVLFAVILPTFNHVNQGSSFSSFSGPTPIAEPSATATIDGRPATPEETRRLETEINKAQVQQSGSQSPVVSPK